MDNSAKNFLYYLSHHPALLRDNTAISVLYEPEYSSIAKKIEQSNSSDKKPLKIVLHEIDEKGKKDINDYALNDTDLAVFMFDHFSRKPLTPGFSKHIQPFSEWFKFNPLKVFFLTDIKEQFNDVFRVSPTRIQELNEALIKAANQSKTIQIVNDNGTNIHIDLLETEGWTNNNGCTLGEVIPSEIATYSNRINGRLAFTGSLLSMIPIGAKHGVINDPLFLDIKDGKIVDIKCSNKPLSDDLNYFFSYNDAHRCIEEVGIGTNEGIQELCGLNASFEEKHPGLHLGLGGREERSFHLDAMLSSCNIYFDDMLVFNGTFFPKS